jgi:hypothetical protein
MNLLKRNSSPSQRHTSSSSASNPIAFTPGSPQSVSAAANQSQSQISPQAPPHHHQQQQHPSAGPNQASSNSSMTTPQAQAIVSSATASIPLLMGGEHSAFRALNPSTAALLAASAQLGLARSYAASLAAEHQQQLHHHHHHNNNNNNSSSKNVASSTSTNQSPRESPHPSESDEEINVHDESDTEPSTNAAAKSSSHVAFNNRSSKTPLELTKRDRN